jgi:eukaryotic-like serine/threonine-protein kinase
MSTNADIFTFGVVLYEMLQGGPLFEGETVSDTLAKVLMQEPDLKAVPVKVQRLLGRCLEKDPKKRLRDIGDVWAWLDETPAAPPAKRSWLPWGVAAILAAGLGVVSFLWLRAPEPDVRSTQFLLEPPADTQFANPFAATAISPDGRYLVFGAGIFQRNGPLWRACRATPLASCSPSHRCRHASSRLTTSLRTASAFWSSSHPPRSKDRRR